MSARTAAPLRSLVFAALGVAVVVVAAHLLLRPDPTRRNYEFMPEMVRSSAVESQSACTLLPGGLAQQRLQPGVVTREAERFAYGPGEDEALRAGRELRNPLAAEDADAARRGADLFRIHCRVCHDAAGGGRGTAVLRGFPPPPSLLAARAVGMADGQVFHILSHGQGNMPPVGLRLASRDRWALVLHVRTLQTGGVR